MSLSGLASPGSTHPADLTQTPANTVAPAVTGTAQVGVTLTCSTGTWSGSSSYAYQWTDSASGTIGGATSATYAPVAANVGHTLTCTVTATNAGGSAAATSAATAAVQNGPAELTSTVLFLPSNGTLYTTSAGSTPAGVGDPVGKWLAGKAGTPYASQATAGNRLVRTSTGLGVNDTTDYLSLSADVVLTGDFTAYIAGTLKAGDTSGKWFPLMGSNVTAGFFVGYGGNVFVNGDSGSAVLGSYPVTGAQLIRIRRSGSTVYLAATGFAETALTGSLATTLTLNVLMNQPGGDVTGVTENRLRSLIVLNAAVAPDDATDTLVRSWITANDGLSL